MNILIEVDALKVTGNELANLAKTDITKFVTLNVGKEILPELPEKGDQVKDVEDVNKRNDEYDDNII